MRSAMIAVDNGVHRSLRHDFAGLKSLFGWRHEKTERMVQQPVNGSGGWIGVDPATSYFERYGRVSLGSSSDAGPLTL
jgi:hypothetical protein